ncbi:thioredoxin family protein [Curtobacterium sp. BRB10]|uniref:thioredoxin family protein n=2 Tax=unclassified Curtobacterium TaxID=257496 RepID=UPI002881B3B6|nr:thioredoxin family protein [Curtobacterium sp. BRB10]MDT0234360.1 thioredoxin family protein [Curtobacterium sp. BRB10]
MNITMQITLQYFDGCPNWQITEERLATIAAERSDVTVTRQFIATQAEAEAWDFHGSPSVLIDGAALFPTPDGPPGLSCRMYLTPDGLAGSPTLGQLRDAIAEHAN